MIVLGRQAGHNGGGREAAVGGQALKAAAQTPALTCDLFSEAMRASSSVS